MQALLNKSFNLNSIINKNPFVINISLTSEDPYKLLAGQHRMHAPIINENNYLIDFIFVNEIVGRANNVVIMAGGLGSRLKELTNKIPKPMLKVGHKPLIEHVISMFTYHGFNKFILCVNYKADVIKKYFGDGHKFGITISYIEEKNRLGTGGALSLINKNLKEPFFVVNADVLSSVDYVDLLNFHIENKSIATMCSVDKSFQIPYGVVSVNNKSDFVAIDEKPSLKFRVNAGIYVFNYETLERVPKNQFFDLPDLFNRLMTIGKTTKVYKIDKAWVDIGKLSDFEELNERMTYEK